MRFSRQRFWSGLPFPSPGDLPNPGIEPGSPALQADSLPTELQGKPQIIIDYHYEHSLYRLKFILIILNVSRHCVTWTQSFKWTQNCGAGEDSWEPLGQKEIKPVNPKGNQPWIFMGRTKAEAPILWPPDVKSWLTGKDPDAGKDWRQKKGVAASVILSKDLIPDSMNMNLSKLLEMVKDREAWRATVLGSQRVRQDLVIEGQQWSIQLWIRNIIFQYFFIIWLLWIKLFRILCSKWILQMNTKY